MAAGKLASDFKFGRFAPSTTGRVHPGTLLSALLCWLDARAAGARVALRLEDLDAERTKPGFSRSMEKDLEWFGLTWDSRSAQSDNTARYDAALEDLIRGGRVYACDCSRAKIKALGQAAPDGSHRYPGICRANRLSPADWRNEARPMRLQLDPCGSDASEDASRLFGDPVLRRRGGAYAYHFASILDDAQIGVDRIVRGRDLEPSTLLQVALQKELGLGTPSYRHHALLLDRASGKLSKSHGAVDVDELREKYDPRELCGRLASFVGLVARGTHCSPTDLIDDFDWQRVAGEDLEVEWDPQAGLRLAADA
jgi:glutamyl-Q tRNA(Asp) synthetase